MSFRRQHIRNVRAAIEAGTPLEGEYVYDETLQTIRAGDGVTMGGNLLKRWGRSYAVSPAQITASQNDYNPTDLALAETLFLTADAARGITGLAAQAAGRQICVINRGAFDITLVNASASSTAANRFQFESDVVLRPNGAIILQYSGADSRWLRAESGTKISTLPQELLLPGVITPAQITANQSDYAPVDAVTATKTVALASELRLSSDATRNITGLVDPREGSIKLLNNVGNNSITLKNADISSAAANRFDFGADVTLQAKQSAVIRYDGTDQRWKLLASTSGAAVAAGAVTALTLGASAAGLSMINGTLVESHSTGAVTFALKTLAGADPSAGDPVLINFQTGAGGYVQRSVTAALSLTISSGSSLGVAANSEAFRVQIVAVDNAGTVALGAINCRSGINIRRLSPAIPVTTVTEGGAGAADSAQVIYTAAGVAGKYISLLGFATYEAGLASTGTWNVSPTSLLLHGPGTAKPGDVLQTVRDVSVVGSNGTTVLPFDNTIPQITEGDQFHAVSLTPFSAANVLEIEHFGWGAHTVSTVVMVALFRDAGPNAISASSASSPPVSGTPYPTVLGIRHAMLAASAAATTFSVRMGANGGATFAYLKAGNQILGGVGEGQLIVSERAS